jgi:hypothetical protein
MSFNEAQEYGLALLPAALARSFKLGWSERSSAFVLEPTGETLRQVLARLVNEQLGTGQAVQL